MSLFNSKFEQITNEEDKNNDKIIICQHKK